MGVAFQPIICRRVRTARMLAAMPQGPWTLEPSVTGIPEPGCPHCITPGYPHRHWRQQEHRAPAWEPNRFWRVLFRIYGDGSQAR